VGPERKGQLAATEAMERMRQETDALIVSSRRLLDEMHLLLERTQQLA
jgi:hypothetical protein